MPSSDFGANRKETRNINRNCSRLRESSNKNFCRKKFFVVFYEPGRRLAPRVFMDDTSKYYGAKSELA